jgi:DNA polymerase-3 subunit beta
MKIICNRGALLEALNVTGNAVAAKSPKPVLQCIKVGAEKDQLSLFSNDGEVAIRYTTSQVQVEKPGTALIPSEKFREIVRETLDDTVSIELSGEQAVIRGNDSQFKVYTQPVGEFPPMTEPAGEPDFKVAGGHLKQLINQTLFCAAREASRYAFNGVLISSKQGRIHLVATDARRLAQARGELLEAKKASKDGCRAIVPSKTLTLLEKVIGNPDDPVSVFLEPNRITFQTLDATLTSNLLEGQFPPFEEVIPKDCDKKMTAAVADLSSAIRRGALLTSQEHKGLKMSFSRNGITLRSSSPGAGEAEVRFPCKFEGSDLEITFNPDFLTEALRVIAGDEVSMEMTAPNRPGLMKCGEAFQYVIMPVTPQ